jgi:hypothetical protein
MNIMVIFWHGNPNKYNPNDIHPVINKSFGELYQDTIKRAKELKDAGFILVSKWGK